MVVLWHIDEEYNNVIRGQEAQLLLGIKAYEEFQNVYPSFELFKERFCDDISSRFMKRVNGVVLEVLSSEIDLLDNSVPEVKVLIEFLSYLDRIVSEDKRMLKDYHYKYVIMGEKFGEISFFTNDVENEYTQDCFVRLSFDLQY